MAMNVLVLQSGGPTAVVNASLWAVIQTSQSEPAVERLWGARRGLQGLMNGDWVDLTNYRDEHSTPLELQAGAALGSGRVPLNYEDVPRAVEHVKRRNVRAVLVIGGNGSMAAARKLEEGARTAHYPLQVIGVPKTIDNDLVGTDVAPGYGSAARFVAQSVHDIGLDLSAMREFDDVAIFEVMGRYAGWLAAAASLARWNETSAPHLIIVPEVPFDEEIFIGAVRHWRQREGTCVVVVAEGARDARGAFLAERYQEADRDASGQKLLGISGGPAPYLAQLVNERLKLRCRQLRPDTIQRSSTGLASEVDRQLARQVGVEAIRTAVEGRSGIMIGLERQRIGWRSVPVPLEQVIARERTLPPDFIDGLSVTSDFLAYARPLIGTWSPAIVDLETRVC